MALFPYNVRCNICGAGNVSIQYAEHIYLYPSRIGYIYGRNQNFPACECRGDGLYSFRYSEQIQHIEIHIEESPIHGN